MFLKLDSVYVLIWTCLDFLEREIFWYSWFRIMFLRIFVFVFKGSYFERYLFFGGKVLEILNGSKRMIFWYLKIFFVVILFEDWSFLYFLVLRVIFRCRNVFSRWFSGLVMYYYWIVLLKWFFFFYFVE